MFTFLAAFPHFFYLKMANFWVRSHSFFMHYIPGFNPDSVLWGSSNNSFPPGGLSQANWIRAMLTGKSKIKMWFTHASKQEVACLHAATATRKALLRNQQQHSQNHGGLGSLPRTVTHCPICRSESEVKLESYRLVFPAAFWGSWQTRVFVRYPDAIFQRLSKLCVLKLSDRWVDVQTSKKLKYSCYRWWLTPVITKAKVWRL